MGRVRRLNPGVVVGMLYFIEGNGMGREHSEFSRVYVGDSRSQIDDAIREDHGIKGDIQDWLKGEWGSLTYYDDTNDKIRKRIPPLTPTRVEVTQDIVTVLDYGRGLMTAGDFSLEYLRDTFGITEHADNAVTIAKGTIVTLTYHVASRLVKWDSKAFRFVEGGGE